MLPWLRWLFAEPKSDSSSLGKLGEKEAAALLKSKGYSILTRNWKSGKDEIDLVCQDREALVFVEARNRKTGSLVSGYDSIDSRKKEALLRVCRAYIAKLRKKPRTSRFDVVEVEHDSGQVIAVRHFENVPLFGKAMGRGV